METMDLPEATSTARTGPEPGPRPGHFPPLDGLRGVALLMVVFTHFFNPRSHGSSLVEFVSQARQAGWVGVNLFFVLSGFLISGILIDSRGTANYYRTFYARRSLRIFPLYYFTLIALFYVVTPIAAAMGREAGPWPSKFSVFCYLANYSDLFPAGPATTPMNHLWSLSVEEQIYLAWPAIIAACPPAWLGRLMALLVPASLAWRAGALWSHRSIMLAYTWTPACLDAFAAGAIVAILVRSSVDRGRLRRWSARSAAASLLPLLGMASALGTFNIWVAPKYILTIGLSLISVFFASVILRVVSSPTSTGLNRTLSAGWLRDIGKYSYAMYLFHMPVGMYLTEAIPDRLGLASDSIGFQLVFVLLVLAVSYGLARLSWALVEKPFIDLKRYFPSRGRGVPATTGETAAR